MLIIRDSYVTFGLGALGGSLGSLLGALGGSLGFTSGALGCSSVSLGALLVSFWMLLRPFRHRLGAPGFSETTFKQDSHLKRRFLEHVVILPGLLLFLMPDGWVCEFKIVPRKVRRV